MLQAVFGRLSYRVAAVAAALIAVFAGSAWALAGHPDESYGVDGVSILRGVGLQADAVIPAGRELTVVGFSPTSADGPGSSLVPGTVSVLRLGMRGRRVSGFGSVLKVANLIGVDGAVSEGGGRIVVATTVLPKDQYPCTTVLRGFDARGHVDPSFGAGGSVRLSAGCAVRLLRAVDGTLVVVGENTSGGNVTSGVSLVRVSPAGQELSATRETAPVDFSMGSVSAAVVDRNGEVTPYAPTAAVRHSSSGSPPPARLTLGSATRGSASWR